MLNRTRRTLVHRSKFWRRHRHDETPTVPNQTNRTRRTFDGIQSVINSSENNNKNKHARWTIASRIFEYRILFSSHSIFEFVFPIPFHDRFLNARQDVTTSFWKLKLFSNSGRVPSRSPPLIIASHKGTVGYLLSLT